MTGKKRIFAGMGILLGVLVGVQGTAAYQSAYDKAVNIVTPGNIFIRNWRGLSESTHDRSGLGY